MAGFSIPSAAIPAILLQTAGGKREGQIYVMERVPQHAGPETPLDMLNRAEGFFAFRPKDNGAAVLLVAKARTVSLTVPATAPEDTARLSAAKRAHLERGPAAELRPIRQRELEVGPLRRRETRGVFRRGGGNR